MRKTLGLVVLAIMCSSVALASHEVAVLDGTSWKVEVKPDSMAKDKGEQEFKETLTFADGNVSLSAAKVGGAPSPYTVSKTGEKDMTFKADRSSAGEGSSTWTGTVHGNDVEGKLIWTKNDGAVLTYTFRGSKLD
jgi:hypothetical protein